MLTTAKTTDVVTVVRRNLFVRGFFSRILAKARFLWNSSTVVIQYSIMESIEIVNSRGVVFQVAMDQLHIHFMNAINHASFAVLLDHVQVSIC